MTLSSMPSDILNSAGRKIQALLFVAASPVSLSEIGDLLSIPPASAAEELRALQDFLLRTGQGIVLQKAPDGWRMTTAEETAEVISLFRSTVLVQKIRLSKAAVETLAVIAYNQPVTRSDVEDIRGVRCERVIETLLSHGLLRIAGRRKGTGSPLLYRTTTLFLETFGLSSISELPTLEELEELNPSREDESTDFSEDENV